MRKVLGLLTVGALLLTLSACSTNESLANQYKSGTGKNYIAGDGSITEVAEANRGEAIAFEATDLDGNKICAMHRMAT